MSIPIFKGSGDVSDPNNYRNICVSNPFCKLLMSLLNRRLELFAAANDENNAALPLRAETQCGFRQHHCIDDLVMILQSVIQHSVKSSLSLKLCFIDIKKAYDSVNRM